MFKPTYLEFLIPRLGGFHTTMNFMKAICSPQDSGSMDGVKSFRTEDSSKCNGRQRI